MQRKGQQMLVAILLLTLALTLALIFPMSSNASSPQAVAKTLDRDADPVIIAGSSMPAFAGALLSQLFVYAYVGDEWQQIPWQFDEVNNGRYVASDNGILDAADELVVMGGDCGDQALPFNWISDASARSNERFEIRIIDPLDSAKFCWIYVYRSTSLADTVTQDYVSFDTNSSTVTTPVYILGFFTQFLGANRLELNGSGIDVLDRTKFRLKVPNLDPITEEALVLDEPQPGIVDGRVRAISGFQDPGQGILTIAYRSQFFDLVTLDLSWSPLPFEWARAATDFNQNMNGGTYFDANTASGVPVDGNPDTIATSPASLWQQISAASGTVIHAADASSMQGTLTTFYKDDDTLDPMDTGDQVSYGEMGMTVTDPSHSVNLNVTHYILPAGQPNIGASYYNYFTHPLQSQAVVQWLTPPAQILLPIIIR